MALIEGQPTSRESGGIIHKGKLRPKAGSHVSLSFSIFGGVCARHEITIKGRRSIQASSFTRPK